MIYRLKNSYVKATRWNVPRMDNTAPGKPCVRPKLTAACHDHSAVQRTSYGEIAELLGTSGCSKQEPYWDWAVLGLLKGPQGVQVVCPGDWIVELHDGSLHVFTETAFEAAFDQVEGADPSKRQTHVVHS